MSFEHFDRFFLFATIGLGLFLAGGVNFVLGRGGRRVWLRACGTLAVGGLVVAGLAILTRPELAIRAAWVLGSVLATAALLGSAWFGRQVAALIAVFRKPAARWGLVALSGLGVVLTSGFAFDRADEAATEQDLKDLDLAVGRPPSKPTDRARATTDRGTNIVLKEPLAYRPESELHEPEKKFLRNSPYREQIIRRGGPADSSNCHGWVFTGGKFLLSGEDVELILKENGYQETHEPRPGDVAIYRQGGGISHTALVRYVAEGQPALVEGKWGVLGVFLHPADKSCYGTEYTFYRSTRSGHLLVGLGGSPGPAGVQSLATE
jgi:hypothetical protein